MMSRRLLGLALAVPVLCSAGPAAARMSGGYIDFLSAEAVGELRAQRYDVYQGSGDSKRFVGNVDLPGGSYLGGGIGLRLAFAAKNGLRFSGESSISGGWMNNQDLPFAAASTALRGELLGSVGYQLATGPLVWHVAGVLGCDFMSFKAAQPTFGSAPMAISGSAGGPPVPLVMTAEELRLERFGLRAGAQAGVHLQMSGLAALYSDVTFDYDGQWRVRFGIAVGTPNRR
ncbi:MAG: hypothetical protein U1A78_32575 [Polyangia bacterium]